jgi:chorismate mutase/prephenate dehydratase
MKKKSTAEKSAPTDMGISELRSAIDKIDTELLALLNRRASYSLEVGRIKSSTGLPVLRPARERALLDKLIADNPGPLPEEHLLAIYSEILSSSRALQRPMRVAFLGPEGTFSNIACLEYFGSGFTYVPKPHLADIFEAVEKDDCALGIVPLENSVNGSVGQTLDLFAKSGVFVLAEWFSRIRLCLMSCESSLQDIRVVYSHAQPLGQCSAWLRGNLENAKQVSLESTALSAQRVAGRGAAWEVNGESTGEVGSAVIGHAGLAERFGLNVLATGIEDLSDNWTRFFVIGPKLDKKPDNDSGANKSSIVFTIANKPGSLQQVLNILSSSGINMSKLESRPLHGELWNYIFFADLDCDITAPEHVSALTQMHEYCLHIRVLGVYPQGRRIHAMR